MSNFWTDPFGLQLIKCNHHPEETTPPMQQPNNPIYYPCYYAVSNYGMFPMQQISYYQVHMNPVMNYCQSPMQYANIDPIHECVACNATRKCKKCIKEEERNKQYVTSPTFSNPRSTYRKGIFSKKNISSS